MMYRFLPAFLLIAMMSVCLAEDPPSPDSTQAPKIFLDKSPRVVAYQLKRLTNPQLIALDRRDSDPKYRPIYEALLTREGLERKYRDEAIGALSKLDKSDPVSEILGAIGNVGGENKSSLRELVGLLMGQKPAELKAQRQKLQKLATVSENEHVQQVAYAAIAVADSKPDEAWQLAEQSNRLHLLLAGIPFIPHPQLRAAFFDRVSPLVDAAPDQPTHIAAIDAISSIPGHEAETFKALAALVQSGKPPLRDAAVRSIRRISSDHWPQEQIGPLANDIVKLVEQTPGNQRTQPAILQAIQLGSDLAEELAEEQGLAIKKKLRELGVRVVVIRTLREQMQYDTRYFAVQAGKPVQIVLENEDAMPHNLVITQPGAMQEVAVAAGTMPPPADPNEKAYIPKSSKVLESLKLVQPDESETLSFTAPTAPGEYDFVCTFPGHWVRMYGVMLVVPNLDVWEKDPKPPSDPLTHKPFDSQKNAAGPAMR